MNPRSIKGESLLQDSEAIVQHLPPLPHFLHPKLKNNKILNNKRKIFNILFMLHGSKFMKHPQNINLEGHSNKTQLDICNFIIYVSALKCKQIGNWLRIRNPSICYMQQTI